MKRKITLILIFLLLLMSFSPVLPGCTFTDPRGIGGEQNQGDGNDNREEEKTPTIPPDINIQSDTENPVPGDHVIIEMAPFSVLPEVELVTDLEGELSRPYLKNNQVHILYGISYDNEPGKYELLFEISEHYDESLEVIKKIELAEKEFDEARFTVPPGVTEGWTAEQLEKDRAKVKRARETTEPEPLWQGAFIWPLEDRISSDYGAIRIINDGPPRRHNGIDIAAPQGTPFVATNDGIVRLAEHLLASGNVVYIDHGLDLSSAYLHLHEIYVEEGQRVEKGEVIGTVGETGFASGPHLHWSVFIGHMPVSPYTFMEGLIFSPVRYVG